MKNLLIIEDGTEYEEFARLFLGDRCRIEVAHSAAEALALAQRIRFDALLVDLRFDRAPEQALVGDIEATALRLFAGDRALAVSYLKEHQGTLALAELRKIGCDRPALFVHNFSGNRLRNLRQLYGDVRTVSSFDAQAICAALEIE